MKQSIQVLKEELKNNQYNLSITPEFNKELKEIIRIKIEDLNLSITCLELVSNGINPFSNGAFCNQKNKKNNDNI